MKKIYIRRKISSKNTEAELNNMQTPRHVYFYSVLFSVFRLSVCLLLL